MITSSMITRYARTDDIITSEATITASGVDTDPDYGTSALYDRNPAIPMKLTHGNQTRVVLDFGTAVRIDAFAMPNSNEAAGAVIEVALNATNVWTSPSVLVNMVMGPDDLMGHKASPWVDFTTASGYDVAGFRYLSFLLPAQSDNHQIGEVLVISTLRNFTKWIQFNGRRGAKRPTAEGVETEFGIVRVPARLLKQRVYDFTIRASDADLSAMQDICDAARGRAFPWFFVWESTDKTDGGIYVRFTKETADRLMGEEVWFDIDQFGGSVEEVSRSVPL